MTVEILTPLTAEGTDQYHLPEAHRKAILAQSDSSLLHAETERMRVEFTRLHGCEIGINCARKD
jgi:hypothetical protein